MKTVYLLLTFSVYVNSRQRPVREAAGEIIPIISYINQHYGDGSYVYSYTTGNGISVEEEGELKPDGENGMGLQTARGSYSYTAPNGKVISVTWYADETGFHPEGEHIPRRQDLLGQQGPTPNMPRQDHLGPQGPTSNVPRQDLLGPQGPTSNIPSQDLLAPEDPTSNIPRQDLLGPQGPTSNIPSQDLLAPEDPTSNIPRQDLLGPQGPTSNIPRQDLRGPQGPTLNIPSQDLLAPEDPTSNIPRKDLRGPQGPTLDMLPPDKGYNYEPPSVPFAPVYPIK